MTLGLLLLGARAWAGGFALAGLSLATSHQDLENRYPHSHLLASYVYVSPADSHDHIYGVEIRGDNPNGRLRINFERPAPTDGRGRPHYPSCEKIATALKKAYGAPTRVDEFTEEAAQNRRLFWTGDGEDMVLMCFRLGTRAYLTEAIMVTPARR